MSLKVVINRKRWMRGNRDSERFKHRSQLWHRGADAGCCLGHAMHQVCKIQLADLHGIAFPNGTMQYQKPNFEKFCSGGKDFLFADTQFSQEAAAINDDGNISDKEREKKLKALFKENGLKLTFKN